MMRNIIRVRAGS